MESREILTKIKNEGIFTAGQDFDQFLHDLCKRFARAYGELLPTDDLDYIVQKLQDKGELSWDNEDDIKNNLPN